MVNDMADSPHTRYVHAPDPDRVIMRRREKPLTPFQRALHVGVRVVVLLLACLAMGDMLLHWLHGTR
ncbi:hypothetical protein CFR71_04620 [Novacetimonas pomaceti]|uniref:Uncharacterized protein n=2 Tax=Novacetimonas pomaceti TaxID=2021998 RepID=A0A318QE56_9PROT|nr:hypothetical protein CFR71_04620 [Novacetimonas pomaceti]